MPMRTKSRPAHTRRGVHGSARHTIRTARSIGRRNAGTAKTSPVAAARNHSISSYSKALRFLASLSDIERLRIVRYNTQNFDLDRMRTLLRRLGNPQDSFKSVHIAGTKGKGSTCAMIASMLQACGYKVGLYTSPHLVDVRERIQVNGEMIGQAEFARLIKAMETTIARMKPTPSYFDVLTAAAFK